MSNFSNFERPVSEYDNSRISVAIFAIFHRNSALIRSKFERYDRNPRTHGYQWPYPPISTSLDSMRPVSKLEK